MTNGAVWLPNHLVVYHLKEGGFPYTDSVQQHPALTGTSPASTTGAIGKGCLFNGSSQYLNAGIINAGTALTLSAWVKTDATASSIQTVWASKPGGYTSNGIALYVNSWTTTDQELRLETSDGTNGQDAETGTGAVSSNQWHYVAAIVDRTGGTARMFVDGVDRTGKSSVQTMFGNQNLFNIGRFTNGTFYFKGTIDEARIESGTRSSNWVWASWMTVESNSVFSSYSPVTQQQPVLSIDANAGGLSASWPGSGVGFRLYTASNLVPPVAWSMATNQPFLTNANTQWQITLPSNGGGPVFYRLQGQ
jgi:hypothetical protein